MKNSEALRLVADRVRKSKGTRFICLELWQLLDEGHITQAQLETLKKDIGRRLHNRATDHQHLTLESWLRAAVPGYRNSYTKKTREHRAAWAKLMASEWEAKGK